jgi:predicted nucleic acid-binding protein
LIDLFGGEIIGVDTSPFIYFFEKKEAYLNYLRSFFKACSEGKFEIVTSTVTLSEILVNPYKNQKDDLVDNYLEVLLNSKGIRIINIDVAVSKLSAKLRSIYSLKTPDAIQIASSIISNAKYFLTNDKSLKKISEIEILILDDILKQK